MKAKELVELTTDEIEKKLSQYKEELFNLRFQLARVNWKIRLASSRFARTLHVVKRFFVSASLRRKEAIDMSERGRRKVRIGKVVSDKMDKTIVVEVETYKKDPLYGKRVKYSKRFKAHDEENQAKIGDRVQIMETRPLSKDKRWRLVKIVEKAVIV